MWGDNLVYDQVHDILGNVPATAPIELHVALFAVDVLVIDVGARALGGAAVFATFPNGTSTLLPMITDNAGMASLGPVPGGNLALRVVWQGVTVYDDIVLLNSSGTIRVDAAVYYLTVTARDTRDLPVENVQVLVTDPARELVVDAVATDATGNTFARLPAGVYNLTAWWSGTLVAEYSDINLTGNLTRPLNLSLYYVTYQIIDADNESVLGAFVSLESATYTTSGITDDQGEVVDLRVPGGEFEFTVTWDGVVVRQETVNISGGGTEQIRVSIYTLDVLTLDGEGEGLPEVFLTVSRDGEIVAAAVTDASGRASFRLSGESYEVSGRLVTTFWLTAVDLTENGSVVLDDDGSLTLSFDLFPIPLPATVLFWVIVVAIVLIGLILYLLRRRKEARQEETGEESPDEEPSPGPTAEDSMNEGDPTEEEVDATADEAEVLVNGGSAQLVIGTAVGETRCAYCEGSVPEDMELRACSECGSEYHVTCAARAGTCSVCERTFTGEREGPA
jgi:hypothetical protein